MLLAAALAAATLPAGPAVDAAGAPGFDHVFLIVMENHSYSEVIGSPSAPYINGLLARGALATDYYAVAHPSLPNYLALAGGSTYGIGSDCTTCWISAANVGDSLEAAGSTWKAYEESMPYACFVGDSYPYVQKHDPFIYFNDIRTNTMRCQAHVVPYPQLAVDLQSTATTPNYGFITPNVCDDMHDCSVATGDAWLSHQVPMLLNSPAFVTQRSLLAITWDEDDGSAGNHVATLLLGTGISGGARSSAPYNHYSLLRTLEAARGAAPAGPGDFAASLMSDLVPGAVPPPPAGWVRTGDAVTSAPVATAASAADADVFARGTDGAMWQDHWNGTGWGGWTSLGGRVTADPGAVAQSSGRIDVFVRGTDLQLYHQAWNGTSWSGWQALGGTLTSGPGASAQSGSQYLDVWVAGSDGQLYHRTSIDGGVTYLPWEALGGRLTSSPAAVSWAGGRIDVFVRGTDMQLYHRWWNMGSGWSLWEALGGTLSSAPTATSCASGRLDVFVRGTDGALYRKSWDGNSWSVWSSLGGNWVGSPSAVCVPGTTTVDLYAQTPDGSIWQSTVTGT